MPGSLWLFPDVAEGEAERLAAALGISALTARVLIRRGLADPDSARRFLRPSLDDLYNPLVLRDMPQAVDRLLHAVRNSEKILIYGDYDVDGTSSVVLLMKAIQLAGGSANYHVPHRLKDGYGMRTEVVEAAAAGGVKLIVSVDTGIRAGEVVARAAELGIDVIVTDHHLPEAELPPALAVLNPNRPDCPYPEKNLCGAAVAFKLAQALLQAIEWPAEKTRRVCESLLKLVAIATVADVVPLSGENRVIVKHGLAGLNDVRNPGLRALLDVAGFPAGTLPTARQVAFQVAPRLNAAGRMDTATAVVEMFLTNDAERARSFARDLQELNTDRQQTEAEIREACARIVPDPNACALVYYSEEWHRGVLGIVASRLVERFYRPAFVLARNEEDGLANGSGRSIPAFHLLEALESMPDLFVRFGGHSHAAGVTLDVARIDEFRERFNAYAARVLAPDDFRPRVEVDAVVELPEISERTLGEIFALAPFGHGNPPPVFAALNVELAGPPAVWNDRNLRMMVRQNGRTLSMKAWNFAARAPEFPGGARVDIAFALEDDAFAARNGLPGWCAVLKEARAAAALEVGAA
jgi:single-stranded-DNA-specific exonuclease